LPILIIAYNGFVVDAAEATDAVKEQPLFYRSRFLKAGSDTTIDKLPLILRSGYSMTFLISSIVLSSAYFLPLGNFL